MYTECYVCSALTGFYHYSHHKYNDDQNMRGFFCFNNHDTLLTRKSFSVNKENTK